MVVLIVSYKDGTESMSIFCPARRGIITKNFVRHIEKPLAENDMTTSIRAYSKDLLNLKHRRYIIVRIKTR